MDTSWAVDLLKGIALNCEYVFSGQFLPFLHLCQSLIAIIILYASMRSTLQIYLFIHHLFILCVCHDTYPTQRQRTAWFSYFTMWVLGLQLRSSALASGALTCWAISTALITSFENWLWRFLCPFEKWLIWLFFLDFLEIISLVILWNLCPSWFYPLPTLWELCAFWMLVLPWQMFWAEFWA